MTRTLNRLSADLSKPAAGLTLSPGGEPRGVRSLPTVLKVLTREKDKNKQNALYAFLQSDSFCEPYAYQTHRVHFEASRLPCFFGVSRSDVFIRYTKPIVLTNKTTPGEAVARPLRNTFFSVVGPSRHALNVALWRSNLQQTGFSQASYPVACAIQDQRRLDESQVIRFKSSLKRAGFEHSEPFQAKPLEVLDAPDDEAPYTVTLLLRQLQVSGDPEKIIADRLHNLSNDGFINYFSRRATISADQGKNLLSGKWSKFFIAELMSWNVSGAIDASAEISDYARRPTVQTAKNLLSALGKSFESADAYAFLRRLIETSGNIRKSLRHFPPTLCQRHIRHVQRVIWNAFASARVRKYGRSVRVGDMVVERRMQGPDTFLHERTMFPRFMVKTIQTEAEAATHSIFDVVLPLPFNDGEIHEFHFPDLKGLTLEDYLEFSEKFGAKYFWDPPPVVRALLQSRPLELHYRCVLSRPIRMEHKVSIDPSRHERNERFTNDTKRLLLNEFTLRSNARSEAIFDAPSPGLAMNEDLQLPYADEPFQPLCDDQASQKFVIMINGKQIEHNTFPRTPLFEDVTLAIDVTLPMDVDFLSCLREVFAFETLCSENHTKWVSRLWSAYRRLPQGAMGERSNKGEGSAQTEDDEILRESVPAEFQSTWCCELCGAVNDGETISCDVCHSCR